MIHLKTTHYTYSVRLNMKKFRPVFITLVLMVLVITPVVAAPTPRK